MQAVADIPAEEAVVSQGTAAKEKKGNGHDDIKGATANKAGQGKAIKKQRRMTKCQHRRERLQSPNFVHTAMHMAAELGKTEELRKALDMSPQDVARLNKDYHTLLHLAARGLHIESCQVLLQQSAREVNLKDRKGNTPLLLSIAAGKTSTQVSTLLMDHGAKVTLVNNRKLSALHLAAEKGNLLTVKMLLDKDLDILKLKNKEGQTALHLASKTGNWKVMSELLVRGLDPMEPDKEDYTPLHWAAKMGYYECCRILLTYGADSNAIDKKGNTPLHLFCSGWKEKADCATILLQHNANVNMKNYQNQTPLHLCHYSPIEVARALIKASPEIDLHITDKNGKTALHCAAERRNPHYLDLVLSLGSSVKDIIDQKDNFGNTALHIAMMKRLENSCITLIKAGADSNQSCGVKGNVLHMAAQYGLPEVCEHLIKKGAKTDIKNIDMKTPMILAAENGHAECCRVLKKKGASLTAKDSYGRTALHWAAKQARAVDSQPQVTTTNQANTTDQPGNSRRADVANDTDTGDEDYTPQHAHPPEKTNSSEEKEKAVAACCKALVEMKPGLANKKDMMEKTPLHLAVEAESLLCCRALLTPGTLVWVRSRDTVSPVKLAYERRHRDIFTLLLHHQQSATYNLEPDIDFANLLFTALTANDKQVVAAIVKSDYWRASMNADNMQKLVVFDPHLAQVIFDKSCPPLRTPQQQINKTPGDRVYLVCYLDPQPTGGDTEGGGGGCNLRGAGAEDWRKNHPLERIIRKSSHYDLLTHRLVCRWIQYKWRRYVRFLHYARLALVVLAALLMGICIMIPLNWTVLAEEGINQTSVCPAWEWGPDERQQQEELRQRGMIPHFIGIIITVLICMCIAYHVFKAVKLKSNYNKLKMWYVGDMVIVSCAVCSFLLVGNFTPCSRVTYIRENWQWVPGTVAMVLAAVYLILITSFEASLLPIFFSLRNMARSLGKVIMFLGPFWLMIFAINELLNKGKLGFTPLWTEISEQLVEFVAITSMLGTFLEMCVEIIRSESNVTERRQQDIHRNITLIRLILDYDQLFRCIRRRFYVSSIPEEDGGIIEYAGVGDEIDTWNTSPVENVVNKHLEARDDNNGEMLSGHIADLTKAVSSRLDDMRTRINDMRSQLREIHHQLRFLPEIQHTLRTTEEALNRCVGGLRPESSV